MRTQVIAITGASAGLGRATARAFAKQGYAVGLIARGMERLEETRRELESLGGRALVAPADVSDAKQVEAAAEKIESELGPIDVWVNNAMATIFAPFLEMTPEEIKRATEVTYLGCVHGTMSALRRMKPRDSGVIVQVGSALAYRSIPLQSAYCAAKHAVVGFTDSVRSELLHDNSKVRITVVNPPALNTPQFEWGRTRLPKHPQPVPPIYEPEVAARAIVWAARHPRREIDVGYPTVLARAAQKLMPALADRGLARSGYEGQQTDEPVSATRPDNLFAPVPGDFAAHGPFSERSRKCSIQFWLNRHRRLLAVGFSTGVFVAALRPILRSR
jgi:short-subunit dehydrogenase